MVMAAWVNGIVTGPQKTLETKLVTCLVLIAANILVTYSDDSNSNGNGNEWH